MPAPSGQNVRLAHRPLACVPCRWAEKIFGESICLSQSFSLAGWKPALPGICARLSRMLPVEHNDPINEKILAISADKMEGFVREPFQEFAERRCRAVGVALARK